MDHSIVLDMEEEIDIDDSKFNPCASMLQQERLLERDVNLGVNAKLVTGLCIVVKQKCLSKYEASNSGHISHCPDETVIKSEALDIEEEPPAAMHFVAMNEELCSDDETSGTGQDARDPISTVVKPNSLDTRGEELVCDTCALPYAAFVAKFPFASDELITFLVDHNVLRQARSCVTCGQPSRLLLRRRAFRCCRTIKGVRHFRDLSLTEGTFFGRGSKVPLHTLVRFVAAWLEKDTYPRDHLLRETGVGSYTACRWSSYCRDVCTFWGKRHGPRQIGGPGRIVEIDEHAFGQAGFNRRQNWVHRTWVFGAVERVARRNFFFVPVPDRRRQTLLAIILTHIRPGTIIVSNHRKAYSTLRAVGKRYTHLTVNNSMDIVRSTRSGRQPHLRVNNSMDMVRSLRSGSQPHLKVKNSMDMVRSLRSGSQPHLRVNNSMDMVRSPRSGRQPHLKVNNSMNMVRSPRSGRRRGVNLSHTPNHQKLVHTNNIKRKWRELQRHLPRNRTYPKNMSGYISEFYFRFCVPRNRRMHIFLATAAELFPPPP